MLCNHVVHIKNLSPPSHLTCVRLYLILFAPGPSPNECGVSCEQNRNSCGVRRSLRPGPESVMS